MDAVTAAIRAVLHNSDETDPAKLAPLVDARLTDADRAAAWFSMLVHRTHLEISRRRPRIAEPDPTPAPTVTGRGKTAKGSHASPRLARAASWWDVQLRQRYSVGGTWKFLKDMTRDDVLKVAAERKALADATARQADIFNALAAAMKSAKAATVADLSEDVAQAAFKVAA